MTTNVARYQRIARYYDLLDTGFERRRYRPLRPLLFEGLSGALLDAGIGTGRNCEFYPSTATVSGIDSSPAMLAVARERCPVLVASGGLYQMDVTDLRFPAASFDGAVASFLFCVLPDHQQIPALRELGRVVKPGGSWNTFAPGGRSGGCYRAYGSRGSLGHMVRASTATPNGTYLRPGLN